MIKNMKNMAEVENPPRMMVARDDVARFMVDMGGPNGGGVFGMMVDLGVRMCAVCVRTIYII